MVREYPRTDVGRNARELSHMSVCRSSLVSFSASPKVSREGEPMVRFTGAHVETTIILACPCLSSRGDAAWNRQGVVCGGAARPLGGWVRDRTLPTTPHLERHFTATATVRDLVIGMSDGLTVPFALAAGLSGTVVSPSLVVVAGLAEIAAGSIAMGLGGYLAAKTDSQHYRA